MQYRKLGTTGLEVSAIGLGGMPMSISDHRPGEADAIGVIHHAVQACGITFIDTADAYCLDDSETGHNERLIGKALRELPAGDRERVVVATKGGLVRPGRRWEFNGTPQHLRQACEASLKALGVDRITLYQYHRIDPKVPLEDSLLELKKLQEEGKIHFIGVSNFEVNDLRRAQKIVNVVSIQNQYSRKHRQPERDGTLEYSVVHDQAFLPWSPLDGIGGAKGLGHTHPVLRSLAAEYGVSPQRIVLAWLLSKAPTMIPIPGASRKETIEDSAKAADLVLRANELEFLNK